MARSSKLGINKLGNSILRTSKLRFSKLLLVFICLLSLQNLFLDSANAIVHLNRKAVSSDIDIATPGGEIVSNENHVPQIDPAGTTYRFCVYPACVGTSAEAITEKYLFKLSTFASGAYSTPEHFVEEYNSTVANKYPDRKLDQAFSQSELDLLHQKLFSPFHKDTGEFGNPVISNAVSTPIELLYSEMLKRYQGNLNRTAIYLESDDPESTKAWLARVKNILHFLEKQIKPGKKIGSCLADKNAAKYPNEKVICSKLTPAEWEKQLKVDERAAEQLIQNAIDLKAMEENKKLANTKPLLANLPKTDDPETQCFQELIKMFNKIKIAGPSFVFANGEDLFFAMTKPNQTPKRSQGLFQTFNLGDAAEKVFTVDLKKPNIKYCEAVQFYLYIKDGKRFVLLNHVEKPLELKKQKTEFIDYARFISYWKELRLPISNIALNNPQNIVPAKNNQNAK